MTSLPAPSNRTGKVLVIGIVIVLVSATVGAFVLNRPLDYSTPTPTAAVPYDFEISADYLIVNITQGYGFRVPISLESVSGDIQSINASEVIFESDSGSSGMITDFDSTKLLHNGTVNNGFKNLLTITAPKSTPTNNYPITVTAKIGSISHNLSITVAVASAMVRVTGTIDPTNSRAPIFPTKIQFWNTVGGNSEEAKYSAEINGNSYSILVPNYKKYIVSVYDWRVGYWDCDNDFWLGVPAGSSSLTKDFTVFGHLVKYEMP